MEEGERVVHPSSIDFREKTKLWVPLEWYSGWRHLYNGQKRIF